MGSFKRPQQSNDGSCQTFGPDKFVSYAPSRTEQQWIDNVEAWQDAVCTHTSNDTIRRWISEISDLRRNPMRTVIVKDEDRHRISGGSFSPDQLFGDIMSVFTHRRECRTGSVKYVHTAIEPTASIVRDPRKCWTPGKDTYTQSKDYILPLSEGAIPRCAEDKCRRAFLFDAGATWLGGELLVSGRYGPTYLSGTSWLFELYKKRGIVFDVVYAWEPRNHSGLNGTEIDPELGHALHFFRHGVNERDTSPDNPLHRILTECTPDDLVIFKLDIDAPSIEEALVKRLLGSNRLLDLVDEFYYEQHFFNPLMYINGLGGRGKRGSNLKSWYDMVTPARKRGLRMHFWP